jgi:hypothetical protein
MGSLTLRRVGDRSWSDTQVEASLLMYQALGLHLVFKIQTSMTLPEPLSRLSKISGSITVGSLATHSVEPSLPRWRPFARIWLLNSC